jgi:hypothetical protein
MKINKEAIKIVRKFSLAPIKGLDKNRPYVLLCKDKDGKKIVLKTSHFQDEAKILKILKTKDNELIVPEVYYSGKKYIIEDYIPGKKLKIFNKNGQIIIKGKLLLKNLEILHSLLDINKDKLSKFTKSWRDKYQETPENSGIWLIKRINRWFSNEQSSQNWRFEAELPIIKKLCQKTKAKTVINFGAFSPSHARLIGNKLGIFDFGQHVRWAPEPYDLAYLWWGYLMDFALLPHQKNYQYWLASAESLEKFSQDKFLFWLCIIERLAGLAKDLTHKESCGQKEWVKAVSKIQKGLLTVIIENLINKS